MSQKAKDLHWRFVMGHYPIHSSSKLEHGDTQSLVMDLDPLLRRYRVDAYFSGHDHILQVQKRSGGLTYYGSGAGGKRHNEIHRWYKGLKGYSTGSFGFMTHELTQTTMKTTLVASHGPGLGSNKTYVFEYRQERERQQYLDDVVAIEQ